MAIARSSFASRASSGARCAISRIVRITPPALRVLKKSIACSARAMQIPLRGPPARREPDDVHAVRQRLRERGVGADARKHILRLVRDSLHPVGLVLARIHEPEVAHAKVLHPAYDVGDVDEVLRLVQDDDDHPTSSSTPRRAGSWRSPRNHTHPPPPLQTNFPTRRTLPGSISLMMRSKWTRPPASGWTPAGQGMATVTQYPVSVRRHPPRTAACVPRVSLVGSARTG